MNRCVLGFAAAAAVGTGGMAHAASVLQIDVNSLSATAGTGFGAGYTGAVTLSADADSTFNGMKIDGADQGVSLAVWSLASFSGTINLSSGAVTGGAFSVSVTNGSVTNTYAASILAGSGGVQSQAGQGFLIDGLTVLGAFSGSTFAGVDVSLWSGAELMGSFLNFAFKPNANGFDEDADIDIYTTAIPLPAGAGLGLVGLAGLATMRRRLA